MSSHTGPVVVGYDGSEASRAALQWATAQAVRGRAPLRIVQSYELVVAMRPSPGAVVPLEELQAAHKQGLESVAESIRLRNPGLVVSSVLVHEPAAVTLVTESEAARTVVIGTRGLGGWSGLLVGSTSVQVAAHAQCPVVVVPADVRPRAREKATVVVGVDGSKISAEAIAFAFDQAEATGAKVLAVHAWHSPASTYDGGLGPLMFDPVEIEEASRVLVAESIAGAVADHPDVEVETRLISGQRARALLMAAESADLLVVGSRGRGGFAGLLLGSVSQGVLHHAHCPVAIVR
ncbi:MAG TPA: universal stress protein [Micromonosporaceae bacterium]|nr:universal stress protein [Micromonosporaceae bacterium]